MLIELVESAFELVLPAEVALAVVDAGGRQPEVRALCARRPERSAGLQLGILPEDRLLERGEFGARVQTEFGGEELPTAADGGQRIGLALLAVLREGEDDPATLTQGRFRDSGARLATHRQISGLQLRIEQGLLDGETDLLEPQRLDPCGFPIGKLGERLPPPEPERFGERMAGAVGLPQLEQLPIPAPRAARTPRRRAPPRRLETVAQRGGLDRRRRDRRDAGA